MDSFIRSLLLVFFMIVFFSAWCQQLQFHYDPRHSLDGKHASKNFTTVYFEYFKTQDSGTSFIKPGSFFLKTQADFTGDRSNIGKFYMQVSQSVRFWKPKIFLQLQYSGGLGIGEPGSYGFYITNAFSIGAGHLFQWKNTWFNAYSCYTYNAFKKPSNDVLFSLYWWKGFLHYKMEFAGDIQGWTLNRNRGDIFTSNLHGKQLSFFGEPQVWYNILKKFSVGSKINLYYHVLNNENLFQVYPTIAARCKF